MRLVRETLVLPIRLYQIVVSPVKNVLLGAAGRCRYEPSCSSYAIQAIRRFGSVRGSWLALCRLCRCHPWGGCGNDPVPETFPDRPKDSRSSSAGLCLIPCTLLLF